MKRNDARKRMPLLSELDGGRFAGHGCLEDDYSEDSGGYNYEDRYIGKPWKTGTTEEDRKPSEVRIVRPAKKAEETVTEVKVDGT